MTQDSAEKPSEASEEAKRLAAALSPLRANGIQWMDAAHVIDRALRRERERALDECRKKCKSIARKYNRPECGEYEYLKAHGAAECAEKIRAMREM